MTRILNEEKSTSRAHRRAHQALIWLKNYRRFKKVHYPLSIYLKHQLDLRRKRKRHDTKSEPNPAVRNNAHRPSVLYAKDRLVNLMRPTKMTKSRTSTELAKPRTFDHATVTKSYGTLNRKWSQWRAKTESFSRTPASPIKRSPSDSTVQTNNKFIEYIKETWVTRTTAPNHYPEPLHWNWKILPQKLRCYDLIPIMVIYGDPPSDNHHGAETRKFFELMLQYFTGDEFHKLKVEWEDIYWCESSDIQNKVTTGINFIKLVGEMADYFGNKRSKSHLFESRIWLQENIINKMRRILFDKLVDLGRLSSFELRHLSSFG